jgi:3-methylcrotonyl-CoA carboxylase alpha subunit
MLAKIITWGGDRPEAIRKMVRALQDMVVLGVTTNIPYLIDILQHPAFLAGRISTRFLADEMEPWRPAADTSNSTWLAMAAFEALQGANTAATPRTSHGDGTKGAPDPWNEARSWRNVL